MPSSQPVLETGGMPMRSAIRLLIVGAIIIWGYYGWNRAADATVSDTSTIIQAS